jgi:hypothetical protein
MWGPGKVMGKIHEVPVGVMILEETACSYHPYMSKNELGVNQR